MSHDSVANGMPTIRVLPMMYHAMRGQRSVEVSGSTLGEALDDLTRLHPDTRSMLFGYDGSLTPYVRLFVDDEDSRYQQGLDTPVAPGSIIYITTPSGGG